jgi:hypothetical protein
MPKPRQVARPSGSADQALTEAYSLDIEAGGGSPDLPKTDPSFPFLLAFDRKRWRVFPTPAQCKRYRLEVQPKVRPYLIPLKLVKGMQNVAARKDREGNEIGLDVGGLLLDQQRRGRIVLPHRLGPEVPGVGRTYCVKVAGRPSYLNAFTHPIRGSRRLRVDFDAWARWLDWLVDEGHVPPVELHVLDALESQTARAVDKIVERYAGLPSGAPAVERMRAMLQVVRAEYERRHEGAEVGDVEGVASDFVYEDGDDVVDPPEVAVEGADDVS